MSTPSGSPPSPRRGLPLGWTLLGGTALLAAGIALGFLLDRDRPARMHAGPPAAPGFYHDGGPRRHQGPGGPLREQMKDRMRERMESRQEFRGELRDWAAPLEKLQDKTLDEIAKILRPEQKERLAEVRARRSNDSAGPRRHGPPLMDFVLIQPRLERISDLLVLDKEQARQVEVLLKKQREEALTWLDANPPPRPEHRSARMEGPGKHPHPPGPRPGPVS